MTIEYGIHKSILLQEITQMLLSNTADNANSIIVDVTFGGGGHSFELLKNTNNLKVLAFDRDLEALSNGHKKKLEYGIHDRLVLNHIDFLGVKKYLNEQLNITQINGLIADLGVSSHHFDSPVRGFSYSHEAELDMRMDTSLNTATAETIVNSYDFEDLVKILEENGEEMFAKVIAKNIIEHRKEKRIVSTTQLESIVFHSYPAKFRKNYRTHPATKTFQALRIEVNNELGQLNGMLTDLIDMLSIGSRFAVISFHSLEDRIVKHFFKQKALEGNFKLLSKKPILPKEEELKYNPRSRSAKLRVIERIDRNDPKNYKKYSNK